jgi:hypothetical protein
MSRPSEPNLLLICFCISVCPCLGLRLRQKGDEVEVEECEVHLKLFFFWSLSYLSRPSVSVCLSLCLSLCFLCVEVRERGEGEMEEEWRGRRACGFAVAARRGLASCGLLEKWRCRVWLLRAAIHPQWWRKWVGQQPRVGAVGGGYCSGNETELSFGQSDHHLFFFSFLSFRWSFLSLFLFQIKTKN